MDNKINFRFHAELENIKSACEKDEKKIHHSGKQPPRAGLAEQVYPVHGTNENQLVCSHFLEPNYRHEINHRNPPIIIRSSNHSDDLLEVVIPKIHDEHREVVIVERLIHTAVNVVIAT